MQVFKKRFPEKVILYSVYCSLFFVLVDCVCATTLNNKDAANQTIDVNIDDVTHVFKKWNGKEYAG